MPKKKAVAPLSTLCLGNVARHMQSVWVKDYSENYLDEYQFRYVMGPFNELAGCLVQDLLQLLGESRRLTRAALHLLLVPHLTALSLRCCPGLVSNAITQLITVRCQNLSSLDLNGCSRVPTAALVDLLEGLPRLTKLGLAETQANTQVLAAVGSGCRRLRELDLSHCRKVAPDSLLHLAYDQTESALCCPALRVLLAEGIEPKAHSQDLVRALAFVLLALPSLEFLANSHVREALCLLHTQQFSGTQGSPGFPSLEELARRRQGARLTLPLRRVEEVEEPFLATFCAVCPEVAEAAVSLSDGPGASWGSLAWSRLTQLTVHCTGHQGRGLAEMLPVAQGLGAQLRSLSLHGFCYDDAFSFCALLNCCPKLTAFSSHLSAPAGPVRPADGEPAAEPPDWELDLLRHPFPKLRHFSLGLASSCEALPWQHAAVLGASLASLLSHSPRLETLALLSLPFSLDGVFQKVLAAPGAALRSLRELSLAESQVSSPTLHCLLALDNELRSLDLAGCPAIHRRDYDQLLRTVSKDRLELDIAWQ
uniref:F-box/LRR-repeat protein 15-like leucin rich repeat domain-containing protein n=1 Tax=Chelydra serpentina TaxID=8475 RepID=A0A8C3XKS0_CHESE